MFWKLFIDIFFFFESELSIYWQGKGVMPRLLLEKQLL